jgi:hypothetical protein
MSSELAQLPLPLTQVVAIFGKDLPSQVEPGLVGLLWSCFLAGRVCDHIFVHSGHIGPGERSNSVVFRQVDWRQRHFLNLLEVYNLCPAVCLFFQCFCFNFNQKEAKAYTRIYLIM